MISAPRPRGPKRRVMAGCRLIAAPALLAASLVLGSATPAAPTPPEGGDVQPPPTVPATAEERLERLRAMSPKEDADEYLVLGRQVLDDVADADDLAVEAEVRCGVGLALRATEALNDAVVELRAAADAAASAGRADIQVTALIDLAIAEFHLGDFDRAVATCREGLDLPGIGDDPDRSWRFLNIMSAVQLRQGDYRAAIETCSEALEGREQAGDRHAIAILLNNIGVAHMYLGDYEPALEFLQRARALKDELGETEGVADLLSNIGDITHLQGRSDEAIEIQRQALRLREAEGGESRIALSQRSLAAALHAAGRDDEALDHIQVALDILGRLDLEPDIASCLAIKAEVLADLGRSDEAIAAATEGLELARKLGMKGREVVALDAMIAAKIAAGRTDEAVALQTRAREIESELLTTELRSDFARFQAAFESREQQRQIELLRKNNEIQALELRNQKLWRNSLLAGIALLLVVAAAGWQRFLAKRREIRDRQRADAALLQSMERYRLLFERNLAGVFQTDLDGTILITNQAFAGMLGYRDGGELSGRSITGLAADPEEFRRHFVDLAANREIHNLEITMVNRDGAPVTTLMNAGRVSDGGNDGELVEGIAIDISDRSRAEEDRRRLDLELQQNQKLESLGVLAGGIAHDFNNMLMAIVSNLSLAKRSSQLPEETRRRIDEAEEACLRATGLTQQLLTFSKGGRPIRKTASMAILAVEAANFAARGSSCRVEATSAPDLWATEIDEGQIVQVIQNLVLNAVQAMPDGGVATVTTDNVHLAEGDVPTLEAGRYVRVEVVDTGTGIKESHLDRIFDPFFTTKQSGSGLGLATAFSIIRSHGGAIVAHSEPGRGSRFSFFIPASDKRGDRPEAQSDDVVQGQGRILIMDDDDAVRSAAAELLEAVGYEVTTAADGAAAIELYTDAREANDPFDAVVLDLTVPVGMGGRETMARLLKLDPQVKAIVSSGYSTDPVMAHFRDHGFAGVAVKPYRLADLVATLRAAIGA